MYISHSIGYPTLIYLTDHTTTLHIPAAKLKMMEEKLIKGGEVISKASKQEAQLRKAENELRERQAQEAKLAR